MSWRRAPAGFVSGPRKLKIVRTASSLRTGTTKRVAVVGGREHEAEARAVDAARDGVGREVDAGAERLEHVGRAAQAGRRAVAVLGQRAARAGGDQRRGRRDVERRLAAAGPGGVDEVVAVDRDGRRERAHRAREAGELVDRLALRAQRDEEARDLDLRGVAAHDLAEHRAGLLARAGRGRRRARRSRG